MVQYRGRNGRVLGIETQDADIIPGPRRNQER